MKQYIAENIEAHPSYEERDLEISSKAELRESLSYVRENVNIETEKELEESKKVARVTDPISSLVRAREYGLKFEDEKLVENAENSLEKLLGKLPNEKVLFAGWFNNSPSSLLKNLEEYRNQETDKRKIIYLVKDESVEIYSAGIPLYPFGTDVGTYARDEHNLLDGQVIKTEGDMQTIKRSLNTILEHGHDGRYGNRDVKSKLGREFWEDVRARVTEEDLKHGYGGKRTFVDMKQNRVLDYLKDFLEEKGYSLEIIDSYDKLPFALDSYVQLGGKIGWDDDKEKILKKLTTFDSSRIKQKE